MHRGGVLSPAMIRQIKLRKVIEKSRANKRAIYMRAFIENDISSRMSEADMSSNSIKLRNKKKNTNLGGWKWGQSPIPTHKKEVKSGYYYSARNERYYH